MGKLIQSPKPPKPPLTRILREDGGCGTCPKCGSSLIRKSVFFGFTSKKKCIHYDCDYEE